MTDGGLFPGLLNCWRYLDAVSVSFNFAVRANRMAWGGITGQPRSQTQEIGGFRNHLLSESVIDLEHFGTIYEDRIRQWLGRPIWNVARREIVADFSNVKLVLQCYLDFEASKGDRAGAPHSRIDASNAGNEEVGAFQVEMVAEQKS